MMKCIKIAILLFLALFLSNPMQSQGARDIVRKADVKRMGNTSQSIINLSIIRPTWTREISLKVWTKGNKFILILITDPAREKGTAYLKRDKEIWSWIPRIDRNIKLPPSSMMQAWMGSDYKNDDLVKQFSLVEDYEHKMHNEESVNGRDSYKIELLPKEESAVVWGKIITWIDKEELLFLKMQYFDEDGELVNTMLGTDIKKMGGRTVTARMEIIPADEPGNKTRLEYEDIIYDAPLDERFFSIQNMKRVR